MPENHANGGFGGIICPTTLTSGSEKGGVNAAFRVHQSGQFKARNKGHWTILNELAEIEPISLATVDSMMQVEVFERNFRIILPSREEWKAPYEAMLPPDGLIFYSDGSLNEGLVGSGVYSDRLNVKN
jgi:hypothetical protein